MDFRSCFAQVLRPVIEHRTLLSLGISGASGILLSARYPLPADDPMLRLVGIEKPFLFDALLWSRELFLYTTPFLASSMLLSLAYVHLYAGKLNAAPGNLPPYPDPRTREDLFLILGERHQSTRPEPSPHPEWFCLPERGLYTGIAVVGAIGTGKTQAVILPAMRQLFAYAAGDTERKLSGLVLEVKGDLCRRARQILEECGRGDDYIEVSLSGDVRYNPLHNSLDPYAQAYNIASIITAIWGRGKEPFWQQSYTDLVRYVILLHRIHSGYVTLLDVFRTVISHAHLEDLLIETGRRFSGSKFIALPQAEYEKAADVLAPFPFVLDHATRQQVAPWNAELERAIVEETDIEASLYAPLPFDPAQHARYTSVSYWYWEHWKFFRSEVKTSIIQGIAVFLSLFETDPEVQRVFCPSRDLYQGKPSDADPSGLILAPFEELIEAGKVVGLNFPVALNPALAKIIGTMMKIDYQRAVLLRIPRMDAEPERHFRPTIFLCDEYQNFATVGGDNPTGDERFLSLSRQPKCIPIVATQSLSSLKEALPNEGVKTLLQAFRTKIFLATSDPETARYSSEVCGKADRTRISYTVSESSTNANVSWLSGRTAASRGSISASKQYQRQREPVFEERVFFELKNAQAVVVAFDGIAPLPATYCYLKPDFLPIAYTWFQQEQAGFDPGRLKS